MWDFGSFSRKWWRTVVPNSTRQIKFGDVPNKIRHYPSKCNEIVNVRDNTFSNTVDSSKLGL
jgi:hypothetical protein